MAQAEVDDQIESSFEAVTVDAVAAQAAYQCHGRVQHRRAGLQSSNGCVAGPSSR
jgi:hypothetical protein